MRHILIFFSILLLICTLLISNLTFAQEKQTAALAPMGSLGDLNEIEKRIIFNSLQESLSKYYKLTSQKMYEKAEEEAFQVIDADECTVDQCIAIIQELLQVEYFFMFEILKSDNFKQMKISRVDIDGNRDVRTATCEDCNISKTNSKVDDLVQSVFKEFKIRKTDVADEKSNLDSQEALVEKAGAMAYWEMIKDSNDKKKFKDFINRFPNSSISIVAKLRLDKILQQENVLLEKRRAEQKRKREQQLAEQKRKREQQLAEQKRREEEERKKKEKQTAIEKELGPYWDSQKCKNFLQTKNYYAGYKGIMFSPYGVNRKTGELVHSFEEANILHENNNLVPDGVPNRGFRFGMSVMWPLIIPSSIASAISNTGCYETNKKDTVAKRFIKFNKFVMQEEISMGKGHHLEALYSIFGCTHSVKNDLNKLIKKNYETIYNKSTYQELEARSIISAVKKVINSDPLLEGNCNGYSPVNIVASGEAEFLLNL